MSDLRPVSEIINDHTTDTGKLRALVAELVTNTRDIRVATPTTVTDWTVAASAKFPQLIIASAVTYRRDTTTMVPTPTDTEHPTVVRVWRTTRDDIITALVDWATETFRYVDTQPTNDTWLATATRVLAGLTSFPPMVAADTGPDDLVIDTEWLAHILTEAQNLSRGDSSIDIDDTSDISNAPHNTDTTGDLN